MEVSEQARAAEVRASAPEPALARPYRLSLGLPFLPGWRGELLILAFFALAACALAWPIPVTLERATGLRGDYFNNLWNAWWVRDSIVHAHSPYWTDHLYFPEGISLRRHTLSPLNSLTLAALSPFLDPHAAFNLLLLAHFALSGWAFSCLARYVTGSTSGGVLAGLVYSFCPFHYFYLCQINVFSFEFLPLGLLFFARYLREGGRRALLGAVLSVAGMAATVEYYIVYAYLAVGVLFLCSRSWARGVPWKTGLRRLAASGAAGAIAAIVIAFPLLYATLGPERGSEIGTVAESVEKRRVNDLLGFYWIGPKEESIVSWPTMLGYSTLLLFLLSPRRVLRIWPWLLIGGIFLVLSLGDRLWFRGEETAIPLPYALLRELPVLSLLRKSDRCFMMVQLVAALAVAAAWSGLSTRLRAAGSRAAAWSLCAALMMTELTGVPFARFEIPTSPCLGELARQPDVHAVMELPAERTHVANGRFVYFQTLHHKKSTLGYTTALAVTPFHDERVEEIVNDYWQFLFEVNRILPRRAAELGVDRIVHYKSMYLRREPDPLIHKRVLWKPFFFLRVPLVRVRQVGEFAEQPLDAPFRDIVRRSVPELMFNIPSQKADRPLLDVARLLFSRACGPPLFEDERVMVFAVPKR